MSSAGEKKLNAVEAEIAGERAASLGRAGMRLRSALDNLRSFDEQSLNSEQHSSRAIRRDELVHRAADALGAFVIQREALGLYDTNLVSSEYHVPPELWNYLGARKRLQH